MRSTIKYYYISFLLVVCFPVLLSAQVTKIMGTVIDSKTKDPIPFVNVFFRNTGIQTTTDFDGRYSIETKTIKDTLYFQYVGYYTVKQLVQKNKFQNIDVELTPKTLNLSEVVIYPGENPAEIILKKIIDNKDKNDKDKYDYYEYEAYNKMQLDANNFTEKLQNRRLIKPFKFVFDNVDTSTVNGKAYLPVFFTESLSDVFFRKDPKAIREVIKGSKISGMENKSISELLGDTYQRINIYNNYTQFLQKNFISPIANFGLSYYKYYLVDSAFIDRSWCYKLMFKPRRDQELTFTGTMWVADTSFAIKSIDMRLIPNANINFINEVVIKQDFEKIDNKYWIITKDNLILDVNVTDNKKITMGFFVHKNTSYKNIKINYPRPNKFYSSPVDIYINDSATILSDKDWNKIRHDSLTKQEKKIYKMVDTIKTVTAFKVYREIFDVLGTRYFKVGYVEFGPVLSIYSFNRLEGSRFMFGMATSKKLSKKFLLKPYVAYGNWDNRFKYGADFTYFFHKNPNRILMASYKYDVEQLSESSDSKLLSDDLIVSIFRRSPENKLSMTEQYQLIGQNEWFVGFSNKLGFLHKKMYPFMDGPYFEFNKDGAREYMPTITTAEIRFNTHFAFREKFLTGEFTRISIGSKYPVLDIDYTLGLKGVLGSDYTYQKLQLNFSYWFNIGPLGWSKTGIQAGKIWGTLPIQLLKLHEGNETYIYDPYSYNTMNYYEFVSDEYIGLSWVHHFDGFFLNKIPLIKKLKFREMLYAKGVIGNLSDANLNYNILPETTYIFSHPYYETGFGIENILKVFSINFIWRLSYLDHPGAKKFYILGTLNLSL